MRLVLVVSKVALRVACEMAAAAHCLMRGQTHILKHFGAVSAEATTVATLRCRVNI
jgi:hypothetical protein